MRVEMVKVKNQKTGWELEFSKKHWLKEVRKLPELQKTYKVTSLFYKELKSFKFIAWVHPRKGGDDYQVEIDQVGKNIEEAKKELEKYLSKISNINTDYQEA